MSKNLTRKSLALGAVVALGSTLIAGAPAFAAGLTLAPTTGTAYNQISGETLSLTAALDASIPTSNASQVKFKIENPDAIALNYIKINNTALGDGTNSSVAGGAITENRVTLQDGTTKTKIALTAADTSVVAALSGITAGPVSIKLGAASFVSGTVKVTAWIDSNNDGVINPATADTTAEVSSATKDVKFIKVGDVTGTTTLTAPQAGDTTAKAVVVLDGINTNQIDYTHFGVQFSNNLGGAPGTALTTTPLWAAPADATKIGTDGAITVTSPTFLVQRASTTTTAAAASAATALALTDTTGIVAGQEIYASTTKIGTVTTVSSSTALVTSALTAAVASGATLTFKTPALTSGALVKAVATYYNGIATGSLNHATALANGAATTTALVVDGNAGTIAVGDVVSGTGVVAGTTVVTVTDQNNLVLSKAVAVADNAAITFTHDQTIGSASLLSAGARTIATLTGEGSADAGVLNPSAGAVTVKTNAAHSIVAIAKDSAATPVGVAGVAVEATITSSATLSATTGSVKSITINGTTYTDNTKLPGYNTTTYPVLKLTTGADGKAAISFASVGLVAGETVTVVFTAQNFSTTVVATQQDSQYSVLDAADVAGAAGRTVVKGGTVNVDYAVVDQFKDAPKDGVYRVKVTPSVAPAGGRDPYFANVVAGKATVSVVNASTAAGTDNLVTVLEKFNASTGNWATEVVGSTTNVVTITPVVVVTAAADAATAKTVAITAFPSAHSSAANALAASTSWLGAGQRVARDSQTVATTAASPTYSLSGKGLYLSEEAFKTYNAKTQKAALAPTLSKGYSAVTSGVGTAASTAGDAAFTLKGIKVTAADVAQSAIDGASVTISTSADVMFTVGSGATLVSGIKSLTFLADAAGTDVNIYSHTAGDVVITIASGSATKTVTLGFETIAGEAKSVAFAGLLTKTSAGRALNVSAVVTDKYGNAVPGAKVTLASSGDYGYLVNEAQQTTGTTGKASTRLVLGAGENGIIEVSATLDLSTDVVVTKTILVGVSAKIAKPAKGATVTVKNALGGTIKVVRGSKVTTKVATSNTQKVVLKSGTGKVNVYVNEVKVASK